MVDSEKIVAIGRNEALRVPAGSRVVDGEGRYLMPGLIEMHVHLNKAGELRLESRAPMFEEAV